jgi:hypothetical protein|tara:strand:- start:493 stop:1056 length:564 start_codon:yes stop_codon:yes gene_type:complete
MTIEEKIEDLSLLQNEPRQKSIAVDIETHATLAVWSTEECRSVGGQIRWLVKNYGPKKKKIEAIPPLLLEDSSEEQPLKWEFKKLTQGRFILQPTQRFSLLELIVEYGDPITNSDLMILSRITDTDAVAKQTSALFSTGILGRRPSQNHHRTDRWEYIVNPKAMKLIHERLQKTAYNTQEIVRAVTR